MTKTGRIITATLLTIATIGLVVFAVKKGVKPKSLQTKAEDTQLTDLSNTAWTFNETLSNYDPTGHNMTTNDYQKIYNINGFTQGRNITTLIFSTNFAWKVFSINYLIQQYTYSYQPTTTHNWTGWYQNEVLTIYITNGSDTTNTQLITWIQNNATRQPFIETAYNNGQTTGYNTGYTEGETTGQTAGYQTGYTAGETAGYQTGYTTGYNTGEETGYAEGYNDSESFNHPIALQPLMLNILTMPFTFISQAFNVTLWPGTQYEFNIANFIKGLIAIATILFIIKMFTSGFNVIGNYTGQATKNQVNRSQVKLNKAKTEKIKKETNK